MIQQASWSAPLEDRELETDSKALTVNPEAKQSSVSASLEDRELDADLEAVTLNPEAQKTFSSTPLQTRGMDAKTAKKTLVVEVSILQQERTKKHKVTISTRSNSKKSKK